eukprot:INCI16297.3.p1 GENE.INCI16297.3~~INCI16297.3.p1  ORF type:complete len:452 (-),score=105.20 INCI16297.3:483-1838(-)
MSKSSETAAQGVMNPQPHEASNEVEAAREGPTTLQNSNAVSEGGGAEKTAEEEEEEEDDDDEGDEEERQDLHAILGVSVSVDVDEGAEESDAEDHEEEEEDDEEEEEEQEENEENEDVGEPLAGSEDNSAERGGVDDENQSVNGKVLGHVAASSGSDDEHEALQAFVDPQESIADFFQLDDEVEETEEGEAGEDGGQGHPTQDAGLNRSMLGAEDVALELSDALQEPSRDVHRHLDNSSDVGNAGNRQQTDTQSKQHDETDLYAIDADELLLTETMRGTYLRELDDMRQIIWSWSERLDHLLQPYIGFSLFLGPERYFRISRFVGLASLFFAVLLGVFVAGGGKYGCAVCAVVYPGYHSWKLLAVSHEVRPTEKNGTPSQDANEPVANARSKSNSLLPLEEQHRQYDHHFNSYVQWATYWVIVGAFEVVEQILAALFFPAGFHLLYWFVCL